MIPCSSVSNVNFEQVNAGYIGSPGKLKNNNNFTVQKAGLGKF